MDNKTNDVYEALALELLDSIADIVEQQYVAKPIPKKDEPTKTCECDDCTCDDVCDCIDEYFDEMPPLNMAIKRIIFNNPATIVYWADGSKTVVKCSEGDVFVPETGVAMAILKDMFGNSYYRQITKVIEDVGFDASTIKADKRKAKKAAQKKHAENTKKSADTKKKRTISPELQAKMQEARKAKAKTRKSETTAS